MGRKELSGGEMMAIATDIYNKKFSKSGIDRDDLIMEGVLGILDYQERYDAELGKLSSYVCKCAYGRMLTYYRKQKVHIDNCESYEDFDWVIGSDVDFASEVKDSNYVYGAKIEILKGIEESNLLRQKIVSDLLDGKKQCNVAVLNNVSKQYVSVVWQSFCATARERYKLVDGEILERSR